MALYLIVAAVSYLLGSIPFGYLLVRIFRGEDIRLTGSGNIGATNVARSGAKGLGIATLALDAMKGALAVWLRFKGGKGVATALGVFCVLFPAAILVALAIFIATVAATRYVSLGSILGAIAFPAAAYFLQHTDVLSLLLASAVSLIVVLKHHENIRRLLSGTENKFGAAKAPVAEKQI